MRSQTPPSLCRLPSCVRAQVEGLVVSSEDKPGAVKLTPPEEIERIMRAVH